MKKLFLMALVAMAFVACDKEDDKGFVWRDSAPLYIQGIEKADLFAKSTNRGVKMFGLNPDKRYTLKEILSDSTMVMLYDFGEGLCRCNLLDDERDVENERITLEARYALNSEGGLDPFLSSVKVYFTVGSFDILMYPEQKYDNVDTVGYIPQSVIRPAYDKILELHSQERYDEIYDMLETEYVFYPCTGTEYKELEKQGLN